MPTECPHGDRPENGVCNHCLAHAKLAVLERRDRKRTPSLVSRFPAEAVAQLVADGVLVPSGTCGVCEGVGVICAWGGAAQSTCPACEGNGKAESWYRLVLPEEGQ